MDYEFTHLTTEVANRSQVSTRPTAPDSTEDAALMEALSDRDLLDLHDACTYWQDLINHELQMRAEERQRAKGAA
jgi:hypothetical protein